MAKKTEPKMPKPADWAAGLQADLESTRQEAVGNRQRQLTQAEQNKQTLVDAFAPIRRYINGVRKAGVSQLSEVPAGATDYSYIEYTDWVPCGVDDNCQVDGGFGVRVVPLNNFGGYQTAVRFETYRWDGLASRNNQYYRGPEPQVHKDAKTALKSFMESLHSHLNYVQRRSFEEAAL